MSKEKRGNLLPENPNCLNLFDKVHETQLIRGSNLNEIIAQNDEDFLAKTMSMYFSVLVQYLASKEDEILNTILDIPIKSIEHGMVDILFAMSPKRVADEYGIAEIEDVLKTTSMNVEFLATIINSKEKIIKKEILSLIFFVDYFLMIKSNPVLAQISFIGTLSLMRDIINNVGMVSIDFDKESKYSKPEDSSRRSDAAIAYYLTTLVEQDYDLSKIKVPAKLIKMQKEMGKKEWKKINYRDPQLFNTNYLARGLSSN